MATTPIQTIIFDFGNVIAHFDYKIAASRIGQPLGLSGESLLELATEKGFRPLLMDLESGRIHETDFLNELKTRLNLPQPIEVLASDWADIFTANEPVHNIAHSLKDSGFKLVLGSNTNAIHARQFTQQFDQLLNRFDALIMSHEVGAMKPAELFYRSCCEAAKSAPQNCLFIDDLAENVEGAQNFGLQALHYTHSNKLISDLQNLGLL